MDITTRLSHDLRLTDKELTIIGRALAVALHVPGVSIKPEDVSDMERLNREIFVRQRDVHQRQVAQLDAKIQRLDTQTHILEAAR